MKAVKSEEGWKFIGYKFRRCILFDGGMPHLSTPVANLPEGTKRVILGVNVFGHQVGFQAARFPDHAAPSLRTIKLYQAFGVNDDRAECLGRQLKIRLLGSLN